MTPFEATKAFLETHLAASKSDVIFMLAQSAGCDHDLIDGAMSGRIAFPTLFDEAFSDRDCDQFEATKRMLLLRGSLDMHLIMLLDPANAEDAERLYASGEAKGLEGADEFRRSRRARAAEAEAAMPAWEKLKAGAVSYAAITARSADIWLAAEAAR